MSDMAKLTHGSITGHLFTQTTPAIIGVAAIMSIGLVDSYFIGQLGSAELAAMSFIFPIGVTLSSLGVGVMVGINSVVARALGEDDLDKARRHASFGVAFAIAVGVVLSLLLLAFMGPLFRLMNADATILPLIEAYMQPFAFGFPFMMAIMGMNGVLRGQGEAKKTSLISISYALANWVLDPLLITGAFGFEGFGMAGAAYASIIGWAFGAVCAFLFLRTTDLPISLMAVFRTRMAEPARDILQVAAPASFANAINPFGLAILTGLIATEGQAAIAGFGAAGRLQSFAVVPLLALSGAIGAIVGQNWGAKECGRARDAARKAFAFSAMYGLVIAGLLFISAEWFAGFFSDSPKVIDQFVRYLHITAWGYAGFGVLIVGNGVLNAINKASWALMQSCLRVFCIMLPIAWILRAGWGADAIYTAELLANLVGGALAVMVVWLAMRRN